MDFFNMFCLCILLPICINFLVVIFGNILDCYQRITMTPSVSVQPDVVGLDFVTGENKAEMVAMQAELKLVKKQLSKLQTKKNKSEEDEKNKTMMQEASKALNKLGVQKSHANSVIKNLCKEKTYNSSEDLLKDAIVYIG